MLAIFSAVRAIVPQDLIFLRTFNLDTILLLTLHWETVYYVFFIQLLFTGLVTLSMLIRISFCC
jgi:hypothetical protein